MSITVSYFIELAIATRVVSVSGEYDQRNKSAHTNIHTETIWPLRGDLHVLLNPAFL